MNIQDIEIKKDNEIKKQIANYLGIPSYEMLSAAEINAIVEAIKKRPDNPILYGDPLEEYLANRNQ